MRSNLCPEFIKLEILSIPPLSWTIEFKRDMNGIYDVLAFHHGLTSETSEVHHGHASEEQVTALSKVLESIQFCPQSGNRRVIADGSQIEVITPSDRFKFFTAEEGENGEAFLHCLQLACSAVLDQSTYQRWKLDAL
jgi:hypothetical protein